MQQCANPFITPQPWQRVCVLTWPWAPMFLVFWMLLLTLQTHSVSLFVRPMWSITFSVMFQPSWLWLALINTSMSWFFFLSQVVMSFLHFLLSWFPTYLYLLPFWRYTHEGDTRRLYLPVFLILLQFPYFMGLSSSCTYSQVPFIPWTQTKLYLCSIPCTSPSWTLWSTAWETKMSRVHSRKLLRRQNFL